MLFILYVFKQETPVVSVTCQFFLAMTADKVQLES